MGRADSAHPYNSVMSKDMNLKFGMLSKFLLSFQNCKEIYANLLNDVTLKNSF